MFIALYYLFLSFIYCTGASDIDTILESSFFYKTYCDLVGKKEYIESFTKRSLRNYYITRTKTDYINNVVENAYKIFTDKKLACFRDIAIGTYEYDLSSNHLFLKTLFLTNHIKRIYDLIKIESKLIEYLERHARNSESRNNTDDDIQEEIPFESIIEYSELNQNYLPIDIPLEISMAFYLFNEIPEYTPDTLKGYILNTDGNNITEKLQKIFFKFFEFEIIYLSSKYDLYTNLRLVDNASNALFKSFTVRTVNTLNNRTGWILLMDSKFEDHRFVYDSIANLYINRFYYPLYNTTELSRLYDPVNTYSSHVYINKEKFEKLEGITCVLNKELFTLYFNLLIYYSIKLGTKNVYEIQVDNNNEYRVILMSINTCECVDKILNFYQKIFDRTAEMKIEIAERIRKNYLHEFFDFVELTRYTFKKPKGNSEGKLTRCLQLLCGHFLGENTAVNYYNWLEERCFMCNRPTNIGRYFEAMVYKASES